MGDTQFEAPTPRQERDLFKQIMQGDSVDNGTARRRGLYGYQPKNKRRC